MWWQIVLFILFSTNTLCRAKAKDNLDFKKFDYCKLNCPEKHSACKAKLVKPRREVMHPAPEEYRKLIFNEHNRLRELFASGEEKRPQPGFSGPAADMMVMNYDLELEYIARCYAVQNYTVMKDSDSASDRCRKRIGNKPVSQLFSGEDFNIPASQRRVVQFWYDQIDKVKKPEHMQIKTKGSETGSISDFLQIIWAAYDLVGCVRINNPKNFMGTKYAVICNYGSTITDRSTGLLKTPIYQKGDPCSKCPKGTKCETSAYPHLCGKMNPVPTAKVPCKGTFNSTATILLIISMYLSHTFII